MKGIPKHIQERLIFTGNDKEPALPHTLTEIVHEAKVCEDCNVGVVNRTQEIYQRKIPYNHWAVRCNACKKMRDPKTGKFELTNQEYIPVLRRYLKQDDK